MLNLSGFFNSMQLFPLIMAVGFVVVFVVAVIIVLSRTAADKRKRAISAKQTQYTDGNGRTEHQREYINAKRRQLAEMKNGSVSARNSLSGDDHYHAGQEEKYDKIIGSLGEVSDEGCDELDGVRLIEHDEAYCDDPNHFIADDPTELERIIVLGEVINTPRFKQMYTRKK